MFSNLLILTPQAQNEVALGGKKTYLQQAVIKSQQLRKNDDLCVVSLCVQARHKQNGELAAIKVIKMEPGENLIAHLFLLLLKSKPSVPFVKQYLFCCYNISICSIYVVFYLSVLCRSCICPFISISSVCGKFIVAA